MQWYNPLAGTWLGTAAVFGLLIAAVCTLFRSGKGALDRSKAVRLSAAYAGTAAAMLVADVALFWVRMDFHRDAGGSIWNNSWGMPTMNQGFVWLACLAIAGTVCLIIHAAYTRKSVLGVLMASLAFFASVSLAADCQLMVFNPVSDIWPLINFVAWVATLVLVVVTIGYVATMRVRAYGERCYNRGRLDALDGTPAETTDTKALDKA